MLSLACASFCSVRPLGHLAPLHPMPARGDRPCACPLMADRVQPRRRGVFECLERPPTACLSMCHTRCGAHAGVHARAGARDSGAFLPEPVVLEGSGAGPLKGYTFAVKDLFDVRPPRAVPSNVSEETSDAWPLQHVQPLNCQPSAAVLEPVLDAKHGLRYNSH